MRLINYGIVGDGKLATHIGHYFNLQSIPTKTWSRKLALVHCEPPEKVLSDCHTILILLKDEAIGKFINEHPKLQKNHVLVHFSGSHVIDGVQSAHPLMTFGNDLYDLDTYEKIPFILEKGKASFKSIFPNLINPHFEIPSSQKGLYHSLCVMGGNFSTILWQKLISDFEDKLQIPPNIVFQFMNQTIKNIQRDPGNALTGPLVRNDTVTIQKNLNALSDDPFYVVYQAFCEVMKGSEL